MVSPFRAGIMLSGAIVSTSPVLNFSIFDAFATAMGCGQSPGPQRLQCLRNVPASTIRAYTNGPDSGLFTSGVDKYVFFSTQEEVPDVIGSITSFDDPLERIRAGQIARVPILLGSMEDDGSVDVYNTSESLSTSLADQLGSLAGSVSTDEARALYPGLSDTQVIAGIERDILSRWCVHFFGLI